MGEGSNKTDTDLPRRTEKKHLPVPDSNGTIPPKHSGSPAGFKETKYES